MGTCVVMLYHLKAAIRGIEMKQLEDTCKAELKTYFKNMIFGLFHLHRIWGLIDRNSYADFWMGVLESKGLFYFI